MHRYDFHRGVDIVADLYSNVYAIADGTVRINGSHPGYSDGVVQVETPIDKPIHHFS